MAQPLENRITSSLRPSSRLKDVAATIDDVEKEIAATQRRGDLETARSIDPAMATKEAREARNNAADLEHDVRRLNASLELLKARHQAILDDESYALRAARYKAAKAERDDLARHIRARYPEIAMELLTMARRIRASEAECNAVNRDRPHGEAALESAERLARACGYCWEGGGEVTRIGNIRMPLLMMNGSYLPIQTSNLTQSADAQRKNIEIDQREAKKPLMIDGAADEQEAA